MAAPETLTASELKVRPLRQDDARGVAVLVADYYAEFGTKGGMSVEQTRQLFATPWLDGGQGLVLEEGTTVVGYGFVRPSRWKGKDTVQFGLTLRQGCRDHGVYHALTDPLIAAANGIAQEHGIDNLSMHLRTVDTVHPPILLELGFREHPVSMLGYLHDLADIPVRRLPDGFSLRPAGLPVENAIVLNLLDAAFDDRDRQGEPIAAGYLELIAGKPGFDPGQVLLVENSVGPVGSAIIETGGNGTAGPCSVLQLAVLPGSRRRGIGSALVCHALHWARAREAGTMLAGMFSSNVAATLFWRLGFRPDPQKTFRFFVRDIRPQSATQRERQ